MFPLLIAACADRPGHDVSAGPEGSAPVSGRWEGVAGGLRTVPDVDGDGLPDALFADATSWTLVRSPLARSMSFPADAFVSGLGDAPEEVMDLDGDGLADLFFADRVALSPQTGTIQASAMVDGGFQGWIVDATGDGVADDVVSHWDPVSTEVRTGWPDWRTYLVLTPSCVDTSGYWGFYGDPAGGRVERVPDLDGDGDDELWYAGYVADGWTFDCVAWLLPGDLTGAVDPDLVGVRDFHVGTLVGDQTGDGIRDFTDTNVHPPVFAGPGEPGFDRFATEPAFTAAAADAARVPFDLDGDGIGEWVGAGAIVGGGPTGGVVTGAPMVDLPADGTFAMAFWEGGEAYVLVLRDGGADLLALGPADSVGITD